MKRVYDFMKIRVVMLVISAVVIAGGIAGTVARGGFNLGIDFQAGLSITVRIDGDELIDVAGIREDLAAIDGLSAQRVGAEEDQQFIIRVRDDGTSPDFEQTMAARLLQDLRSAYPGAQVTELETAYVGPRFSADLAQQAIALTAFALLLILAYLWFRFRLGYALSSIAALVHDVLVILGVIGTFQLEVSTATIAAVLTIIGYSLNDTIVIFDRIRENEILLKDSSFPVVINTSITQSLSRTLITSLTTLLAVVAIYIFSTGQIQLFALKLIIGVVVGTYSSVFVASPVLLLWTKVAVKRRKKRDAEKYHKGATTREGGETVTPTGTASAGAPATAGGAPDIEAAKREIARQRSRKKNRKKR